jgi:hypothetical protein
LNATKESMRLLKQQLTPKWVACTHLSPPFNFLCSCESVSFTILFTIVCSISHWSLVLLLFV